ncbi:hypothetical protein PILCRDRAFT_464427 [Piloderma croceum F 1598]|uniref:Uncharacterized protein n=1 Tax=Piloderma croceum (strain F 1598) TaxID=765440 RepID=A0A0C3BYN7_PILCF|nr:hypothetical protein PILCRDRAFT_464427 [Piloderma croceum F 1598]
MQARGNFQQRIVRYEGSTLAVATLAQRDALPYTFSGPQTSYQLSGNYYVELVRLDTGPGRH